MKKIVILLIVSSFTFAIQAQSKKERKAEKKAKIEAAFDKLKSLVDSQNFEFSANWAIPLGNDVSNIGLSLPNGGSVFQGGRVDISNNSNFIKVSENNADLFLPYFGRVFVPNRNPSSSGIKFQGEIEDYDVEENSKKNKIIIKFNAKSNGDFLKFIITAYPEGKASVAVNSNKRQSITYDGFLKALEIQE